MSDQYASGPEDNATELTNGPGRRLRVARQAQGMDLDRVAAELHLSRSMIEAMEHDDYDALPGQVFIVGYIRKYARVVRLDVEPLLAAYHKAVPQSPRTWLRPRPRPNGAGEVGSGHLVVRLVSFAVLVLLCGLAFVWWQNQPSFEESEMAEAETTQGISAPAMPEPAPEQPAPPLADSGESSTPAAARNRAQEPPLEPEPASPVAARQQPVEALAPATAARNPEQDTPADTATASSAAAADAGETGDDASAQILMTFDGPCWVDVRDSARNYKLFGEMKKGDRHVLGGSPPYSVILGNAAAVQITIDGAAFDLSTVSQGNVARFTLDPSESL